MLPKVTALQVCLYTECFRTILINIWLVFNFKYGGLRFTWVSVSYLMFIFLQSPDLSLSAQEGLFSSHFI